MLQLLVKMSCNYEIGYKEDNNLFCVYPMGQYYFQNHCRYSVYSTNCGMDISRQDRRQNCILCSHSFYGGL
jgi:hypothetical protein